MKVQRILCWGNINRIEDIKLVKKIIDLKKNQKTDKE